MYLPWCVAAAIRLATLAAVPVARDGIGGALLQAAEAVEASQMVAAAAKEAAAAQRPPPSPRFSGVGSKVAEQLSRPASAPALPKRAAEPKPFSAGKPVADRTGVATAWGVRPLLADHPFSGAVRYR